MSEAGLNLCLKGLSLEFRNPAKCDVQLSKRNPDQSQLICAYSVYCVYSVD